MARVVVYPKNIFSKPRYSLLKNNIIKNPSVNYYKAVSSKQEYSNKSLVRTTTTQNNENELSTIIANKFFNKYYYLYNDISWNVYDYIQSSIRDNIPIGDNQKVSYYSYVILKSEIKPNNLEGFGMNNSFIEGNATFNLEQFFVNENWTLTNKKIEFFYKDFDPDNISLFVPINNHESFWYMDHGGTYHSAFTFRKNSNGSIDLFCVIQCAFSRIEYIGSTNQINTSASDINYDSIIHDLDISIKMNLDVIKFELKELKKFDNIKVDYTVNNNEIFSLPIANNLLNNIYNKYNNGRRKIDVSLYLDNYYDENSILIYNKDLGQTIQVGDEITLYDYRNGKFAIVGGEDIKHIVSSKEIEYQGQPIIHLTLIEKK